MLKDLIKLADHLDKLKLFKEADFLDSVILKMSTEITVPSSPSLVKKMIEDAIGINYSEDKIKEIIAIFKESCLDTIKSAEETLKPEDGIENYLELLHPLYFDAYEQDLINIFGEEKLDDFSRRSQGYYPADFIAAINSILEDQSGRFFTAHKQAPK